MDTKVFQFPESRNSDLATLCALNNNGGYGMGNGWGGGILGFILGILLGNGGGFFGNGRNGEMSDLVLGGLNGKMSDIQTLATNLNADVNQVSNAISMVQNAIQQVGAQNGMGFLQVTNAVQAGDAALTKQLCECCCENRLLTTQQGYENRIANMEQTNQLGSQADRNTRSITDAIGAQTTLITQEFCALKERELQNQINSLTAENATLKANINNSQQTAQIAAMIAPLQNEVATIKGKLPETVTLPYSCATAVPTNWAWAAAAYQNNGSIWS